MTKAAEEYDRAAFQRLVEMLGRGEIVEAPPAPELEPLQPGDVLRLPAAGAEDYAATLAEGDGDRCDTVEVRPEA